MKKLTWLITPEYLHAGTKDFTFTDKIGMFDLDNTLITTKNGKKFPVDENDWKLKFSNVKKKILELVDQNYCIIILSNQAGIASGKQTVDKWSKKLNQIVTELNIDIRVFCATENNKYKKPSPAYFHDFIPHDVVLNLDFKKSFFCGDAAGRKGDFSDTDYKFALNCMLNFKTPEHFFKGEKIQLGFPPHPKLNISNNMEIIKNFVPKDKEIIIMVGFPASGKSTLSYNLKTKYKYNIVNQDTLKSFKKCMSVAKSLIDQQKSIIIDATNPSKEVRKKWIDLSHQNNYSVRICNMSTSEQLSMHNNVYRSFKTNKKMVPTIAYRFFKSNFEQPNISEGVDEIITGHMLPPNELFYFYYLV